MNLCIVSHLLFVLQISQVQLVMRMMLQQIVLDECKSFSSVSIDLVFKGSKRKLFATGSRTPASPKQCNICQLSQPIPQLNVIKTVHTSIS